MSDTALVLHDPDTALIPIGMGGTFSAYKQMQTEIDRAMPDQIMTIQGRQFRRKGYWRAVRAAFSLKVWCVSEERIVSGEDWGYSVLYRAEGRNGMSADGDGVCMASEKRGGQATVHNVRSHAHTRAFNRAVSNLVGFGEVSAEEMERDDHPVVTVSRPVPPPAAPKPAVVVGPGDDATFFDEPDLGPDHDAAPVEANVTIADLNHRDGFYKSGAKAGEKYTQYFITLSDGRKGSFFEGQLAVAAKAAFASHSPVVATFEQNGKFTNLTNLLVAG